MMNKLMNKEPQKAPLTLDSPLTYAEMAKQNGLTLYEVRRALGLIQ